MKSIPIILTIALAAVSIGLLSTGNIATTAVMTAPSATNTGLAVLGHVESIHRDSEGNIVGYYQNDNAIVNQGSDCAAELLFGTTGGTCDDTPGTFTWIGINQLYATPTVGIDATNATLEGEPTIGSTYSRHQDTDLSDPAWSVASGATGTIARIDTEVPFSFGSGNNTQNVYAAALFSDRLLANNDPLAILNITTGDSQTGIDVNDGDTLSVTWNITVG